MLILLSIFLLITLYDIGYVARHRKDGNYDLHPFDVQTSTCLKGLLALGIILGHLQIFCFRVHGQSSWFTEQLIPLSQVGVFFFISGYDLTASYMRKGEQYLQGFLPKRLIRLLVPLILATVVYVAISNVLSISKVGGGILITGDTPLPFSWFCYVILLYYISFFAIAKCSKRFGSVIIGLCMLTVLLYVALGVLLEWGQYWYSSNVGFNLGMIVCYYEDYVRKMVARYTLLALGFVALLIPCVYLGSNSLFKMEVMACCFSLIILILIYTLGFWQGRVIRWIGKFSYEIYLTHPFLIYYVYPYWPKYDSFGNITFTITLFLGTCTLAFILKEISNRLIRISNK